MRPPKKERRNCLWGAPRRPRACAYAQLAPARTPTHTSQRGLVTPMGMTSVASQSVFELGPSSTLESF